LYKGFHRRLLAKLLWARIAMVFARLIRVAPAR
jgi:hypothetical protein